METKPYLSIICGFFDSGKKIITNNIVFNKDVVFLKDIKEFYYEDIDSFHLVEKSINSKKVTIIQPSVNKQHNYFNLNILNADKRILFVFRHPGISWFVNQHKLRLIGKGKSYSKTLSQYIIQFNNFYKRFKSAMKGTGYYRIRFESLLNNHSVVSKVSEHIGVSVQVLVENYNNYFTQSELDSIEKSIDLVSQSDLDIIYDELSEYMEYLEYKRLSLDEILYQFSQLMGYDSIISCLGTIRRSIGVDLDGTLAKYDGWKGISFIGEPIQSIVDAALEKEKEGYEIIILTARAADSRSIPIIKNWLRNHNLPDWRITDKKDSSMKEIWDDLAKTVQFNTGKFLTL